jgi:restriction system protein
MQYFALVLEASGYSDDFPQQFRLAFVPESRQLVVEYELPGYDRVPAVAAYTYVKSGDKVTEKARPARERQQLYKSVVAQVTVRTIHELFEADRAGLVETIVFNGTSRPSTPPPARPNGLAWSPSALPATRSWTVTSPASMPRRACLTCRPASLRAPPNWCRSGRYWNSTWSTRALVEEADVLSGLDQRPNLMDLKPGEFESLITNLFTKMGLETRMTQPSRDGGVDCVAYDNRAIFGGKVIIQAKRYKNTVP